MKLLHLRKALNFALTMIHLTKSCGLLLFVTSSVLLANNGASAIQINTNKEVQPLSHLHNAASNFSAHSAYVGDKSSKFLPFLVVVNNSSCIAEEKNRMGTCYTAKRCRSVGGKPSGTCGSGFGVCCIVSAACNSIVTQNGTMFYNPGAKKGFFPSGSETCVLKINKPSQRVCQFRMDFIKMDLAHADSEGHCRTDSIQMFGVDTTLPQHLCGPLSGQHMYLEFGSNEQAKMVINTDGSTWKISRSWEVEISFIECETAFKPPSGCLQYFTERTGQVQILGYPMKPHLAGLHYTICVRGEENAGSIFWFPCQNEPIGQSFLMVGSAHSSTNPITIPRTCAGDYIVIMSDEDSTPIPKTNDRYCGNSLTESPPFTVLSRARPYIIRVNTDLYETHLGMDADVDNTGFCLGWFQNPVA